MALSGSNSSSGGAARATRASAVARRTAAAARTSLSSHQLPRPDKRVSSRPRAALRLSRPGPQGMALVFVHRRDAPLDPGHRVRLHLLGPLGVDRLETEAGGVEGKIRDEHELAAEHEARREEEAARLPALADAVEVAQLRDRLARLVDDHDLVRLIRAHPDVVLLVDREPVGPIDAVGELDGGLDAAGGRDLEDGVVTGVRDEHRAPVLVEGDAVRAERRLAGGGEEMAGGPRGRRAAG